MNSRDHQRHKRNLQTLYMEGLDYVLEIKFRLKALGFALLLRVARER